MKLVESVTRAQRRQRLPLAWPGLSSSTARIGDGDSVAVVHRRRSEPRTIGLRVPKSEQLQALNFEVLLTPDESSRGCVVPVGVPCAGTAHDAAAAFAPPAPAPLGDRTSKAVCGARVARGVYGSRSYAIHSCDGPAGRTAGAL